MFWSFKYALGIQHNQGNGLNEFNELNTTIHSGNISETAVDYCTFWSNQWRGIKARQPNGIWIMCAFLGTVHKDTSIFPCFEKYFQNI